MTLLYFFILMFIFAITDLKYRYIPNFIVIPAAVIGCMLTGNWLYAGIMLLVGILLFGFEWRCPKCGHIEKHKTILSFWRGGDVKLLAMIGAFLGMSSIWVFIGTILSIFGYKRMFREHYIPVAPFMLINSIVTTATIGLLHNAGF